MKARTISISSAVVLVAIALGLSPGTAASMRAVPDLKPADAHGRLRPVVAADPPGSASLSGATCQGYYFPVTMSPSDATVYKLWGQLCTRQELTDSQPVQILIHGGSYNHRYWDWPYQPDSYSYVSAATKRGFATLNIDRLGNGFSDYPPAVTLDFKVAAYVTHQIVQYLRAGALGPRFTTIVLNGHSMGGLTAQREASAYHDVDAVITTGVGHNVLGFQHFGPAFYPTEFDPKYGPGKPGSTPGYMTSRPGVRVQTFVAPGRYDPAIGPVEETNKDVVATTELAAITADSYNPTITRGITAPVLFALGQHDLFWCPITNDCNTDPEMANEPGYYDPGTSFTAYVVADAGHSINMNLSNHLFYNKTFDWLRSIGIDGR